MSLISIDGISLVKVMRMSNEKFQPVSEKLLTSCYAFGSQSGVLFGIMIFALQICNLFSHKILITKI